MKLCPKCNKQFSDDANFCPVDAARLGPVLASAPEGDSLSTRFELADKLGGTRTGTVQRAKDKQSGVAVAVKLVAPEVTSLPGVAQRLERELKQLERVQSAGVTKLLASGKKGDQTWIALELLEGAQTLSEAITARGPIALDFAAHLIEVVGEALIEAAQVGVVHRDLAPKNILFAGSEIKLINFSLPVPTERVPGVPEFVAPEQVEGKPVDQRSNLYSLGALYYYVLTGQTVHAGPAEEVHRAHINGSIKTPSSLAPVPAPVEAVIMRALDRSPTKRFLTVRQFVDEVGRIARGEVDPKAAMPAGKVRPKAELVQTLLGVRGGIGQAPVPAPVPAPAQVPAAPILPQAPVLPIANPAPVSMSSTVTGIPAGVALPASAMTPAALNAPPMAAAVAVAAPLPSPNNDRSPWASPGAAASAQAAVTAPEMAKAAPAPVVVEAKPAPAPVAEAKPAPAPVEKPAPAPAKPVVAAPVVAKQPIPSGPAGKKKSAEDKASKGKFRETMWFKKGDLDTQAAITAAEERAKTGKDTSADKADSLPIDERYKDDGSISRGDKEKYSLRTGATQMMAAMKDRDRPTGASNKISEDELISEMKGGRQWIFIGIGGGILLLILIIYLVF